jgi:hypothetical protein
MTTVNRREAVFATLRFEEQRPCPYCIWIDDRNASGSRRHISGRRLPPLVGRQQRPFAGVPQT